MEHSQEEVHILSYATYFYTWLALVICTVITVLVAGLSLGYLNVLAALFIATVKASLVMSYFMHLKWEKSDFKIMLLTTIVTIGIILALTFSDVATR
ncbi:MAG: cytochrome C oxidase subunit IV family protein [bacterium JZ-2024 1]